MKLPKSIESVGLALLCSGLALPPATIAAEPALPTQTNEVGRIANPSPLAAPASLDVALGEGELLAGQVVNSQGAAMANVPVTVWHQHKAVAVAKTNATGHFAVNGLREGAHFLAAGSLVIPCRLWKAAAAPPAALAKVLLVGDTKVARGQTNDDNNYDGLMWGLIGAGIAAGLISEGGNNNNDHHDSEGSSSSD